MDHVDVEHQVEALWLDSSPVLIGQRSIQVDGRLHIVQPIAGSICFYTNGNKRHYGNPPGHHSVAGRVVLEIRSIKLL